MKKLAGAVCAAALLAAPTLSFAADEDFNGVDDKVEKMMVEMTMKMIEEEGVPITSLTLPGFIVNYADINNDGVLNELEQRRAQRRLKQIMSR
ncbi:MAG: hypothetical protein AAGM38_05935 [Pseudomonadota bacterium]